MAEAHLIDYYAVLNLPATADLQGIENAYARLSDEFAIRMEVDDTSADGLRRLNEAYGILSKPDLRTEYDRAFFVKEMGREHDRIRALERRQRALQWSLVLGLVVIMGVEATGLYYFASGGF